MSDHLAEFIVNTRERLQRAREQLREQFGPDAAAEVDDLLAKVDQRFAALTDVEPVCPNILAIAEASWPPAALACEDDRPVLDTFVKREILTWAKAVLAEFEEQFSAAYVQARCDGDQVVLEIAGAEQYRQFGDMLDGIFHTLGQMIAPLN